MKTQHTPGPWKVSGKNPPMIYARAGLDIVAQCDSAGEMTRDQEAANARLIAAAPDLLAALLALLSDKYLADPINADRMAGAKAAIAKAAGSQP